MTQWKSNEESGGDDVQMPLGTGDSGLGEESYSSDRPKINTSTLALFAAFAAALVVIYLLGLQNKPRAASAEDQARQEAVKQAIDGMLSKNGQNGEVNSLLKDTTKLVQLIRHALDAPAGSIDLSENPFERELGRPVFTTQGTATVAEVPGKDPAKMRQLAEEFQKLKLQMVMMGARPAAMVNGNLVSAGSKLGSFKVLEVRKDRVMLEYEDSAYELKLNTLETGH